MLLFASAADDDSDRTKAVRFERTAAQRRHDIHFTDAAVVHRADAEDVVGTPRPQKTNGQAGGLAHRHSRPGIEDVVMQCPGRRVRANALLEQRRSARVVPARIEQSQSLVEVREIGFAGLVLCIG